MPAKPPRSLCLYDDAGRILCPGCRKPMRVRATRNGRKYAWCCGNSTMCSEENIAALEAAWEAGARIEANAINDAAVAAQRKNHVDL